MSSSNQKRRISATVDAHLLDEIDDHRDVLYVLKSLGW